MGKQEVITAVAEHIVLLAMKQSSTTMCFRFTPKTGEVEEILEAPQLPFATVMGCANELNALLQSFGDWEGVFKIGVLPDQGLLDFWIY
ncbi:hypothetical protein [Pseudomonas sp. NPDC089569]|uniref:hypothetical protein n=1 Tax=Pseudomonas sp. NPDC089569 TaxID=3390722 RepID=UPI003D053D44